MGASGDIDERMSVLGPTAVKRWKVAILSLADLGARELPGLAVFTQETPLLETLHLTYDADTSNMPDRLDVEFSPQLLFFDANTNTLIRRYSDTRRLHPLTARNLSLEDAIEHESELLEPLRSRADLVVDTEVALARR